MMTVQATFPGMKNQTYAIAWVDEVDAEEFEDRKTHIRRTGTRSAIHSVFGMPACTLLLKKDSEDGALIHSGKAMPFPGARAYALECVRETALTMEQEARSQGEDCWEYRIALRSLNRRLGAGISARDLVITMLLDELRQLPFFEDAALDEESDEITAKIAGRELDPMMKNRLEDMLYTAAWIERVGRYSTDDGNFRLPFYQIRAATDIDLCNSRMRNSVLHALRNMPSVEHAYGDSGAIEIDYDEEHCPQVGEERKKLEVLLDIHWDGVCLATVDGKMAGAPINLGQERLTPVGELEWSDVIYAPIDGIELGEQGMTIRLDGPDPERMANFSRVMHRQLSPAEDALYLENLEGPAEAMAEPEM